MRDRCLKKTELLLVLLSLFLGAAGTALFAEPLPAPAVTGTSQLAWWGGMYPEYCLPGAMHLVEGEGTEEWEASDSEIPVKLSFKYLTFLNQRRK